VVSKFTAKKAQCVRETELLIIKFLLMKITIFNVVSGKKRKLEDCDFLSPTASQIQFTTRMSNFYERKRGPQATSSHNVPFNTVSKAKHSIMELNSAVRSQQTNVD